MTDTVSLYDAKTNLSKLVDRAAAGEEIVIAKAGKPKAKLVPYQPPRKKRQFGQNLLGITYIADDFDGPLPPELQKYLRVGIGARLLDGGQDESVGEINFSAARSRRSR